jgi:hypothetical protein
MKNFKIFAIAFLILIALNACTKEENKAVIEEEVITTMTATLKNGTQTILLTSRDLDGDGPNVPVVTVSGNLTAGTNYIGTLSILNETTSPAGNITSEIATKGIFHQFFFQAPVALGTIAYADLDANGKPIGLQFTFATAAAATGNLLITLRHEPNKSGVGVAGGDITNAAGATDIAVIYPIVIQ